MWCLLHGEHAGRCTVHAVTAGLVVLIRQDLTAVGHDQTTSVADHSRVAEMNNGARAICLDAVHEIENYRASIHDNASKRTAGYRKGGNAVLAIVRHNAVAHLNDNRSGAWGAVGDYAGVNIAPHL